MEKKQWQKPELGILEVNMTMAGKGDGVDFMWVDANPHTPGEFPGKPPVS